MKRTWTRRLLALLLAALLALPAAMAEAALEDAVPESMRAAGILTDEAAVDKAVEATGDMDAAAEPIGEVQAGEAPVEDVPAEDLEALELSGLAAEEGAGDLELAGEEEALPVEGDEAEEDAEDDGMEALYSWSDEMPDVTESFFYGDTKRTFNLFLAVPFRTDGIAVKKWKSSNDKVVHLENHGDFIYMYMAKTGTAKVTATRKDGKTRTLTITVKDFDAPTRIELQYVPLMDEDWEAGRDGEVMSKRTVTLAVGEDLMVSGVPFRYDEQSDGMRYYSSKWKISNSKIASISARESTCVVTAKKAGKATLTVTSYNGKKDTLTIKVVKSKAPDVDLVTAIKLMDYDDDTDDIEDVRWVTKKTVTIPVGGTYEAEVALFHNDEEIGDNRCDFIKAKVDNKKIANFQTAGDSRRIYGKKAGKTKVTFTSHNGKKAILTVKVVRNKRDKLNAKPSTKTIKAKYKNEAVAILKSVDFDWDKETIVAEYYIVNGSKKKRTVYVDEITLIDGVTGEELAWKRGIKVKSVPAYGCKVLKVTFVPSEDIAFYDYELFKSGNYYRFEWDGEYGF